MNPIRLYRYTLSGHAHRAELMLSLLGLPYECIDVDLPKGETKTEAYLARNAFGQVPVIEDGEHTIADSNAILVYLALRYDPDGRWLPRDARTAAEVQRWFSAAAGMLVDGPGGARVEVLFGRPRDPRRPAICARLFGVMEGVLARQPWLAAPHATLADIAMYSYTAHAPEGGNSLEPYPSIRAWIARIEALPRFVAMPRSPVPLP